MGLTIPPFLSKLNFLTTRLSNTIYRQAEAIFPAGPVWEKKIWALEITAFSNQTLKSVYFESSSDKACTVMQCVKIRNFKCKYVWDIVIPSWLFIIIRTKKVLKFDCDQKNYDRPISNIEHLDLIEIGTSLAVSSNWLSSIQTNDYNFNQLIFFQNLNCYKM